jgi:hypothetical protein
MGRKKKRLRLLAAQEKARARQALASPPVAKEPECVLPPAPAPKKKVAPKKIVKSRTKKA